MTEHIEIKFKGKDESTDRSTINQPQPYGKMESHEQNIPMKKAGAEHSGPFKQPHGMHTDEHGKLESHEPATNPRGPNKEVTKGSIDNTQGDQLK